MARPFERISDINDTKDLWKVAVRVEHKWSVISNNEEHFEMIFVDKHGCDIHVVVPTTYTAAYNDRFALDQTYTVSNFKVEPNKLVFKPSSHRFLVNFTGGTAVSNVNKHEIQPKQHRFTRFADIITDKFQKNMLIGQYPLSVTNTFHVTKLHINAELPGVKNFVESLSCRIPKDSLNTVSSQLSIKSQSLSRTTNFDNSRQTPIQRLLSGVVALPLSEIKKLKEVSFCATVAETRKLIASSFGWYKIEIEVVHLGISCKFIFWDRECTDILEISAAQMRDTMIQAGITDPLEFPLALDAMLDLELAFRVKWKPNWDSCSVVMLIKDKPFVKQLKAPWEHTQVSTSQPSGTPLAEQVKESVDEAKTDAAEECGIVTDVEITSKHNPDPVTPTAKRQIHDGSNDSTTVAGLCDGELSSTKLKKIIKLEKNI
ncbi:uncharacterized protein LOC131624572 [Vicia villosa]|uniref:uncharacterized protein LOC131624572 n=1 Tax=Vicia villosa TaxID=3911 RepID=UPI00273AFF7A|nr:uncharacterized protein LOC131624572 [Vicia villosa]